MRIVGGKFRSRKLEGPSGQEVRPTRDRVREAVFNIISGKEPGAKVLDLFAGTGSYGLESLSRGAGECLFVEKDIKCVNVITRNIQKLRLTPNTRIEHKDVELYLRDPDRKKIKYDLVFMDPPYFTGLSKKILIMIDHYDILSDSGVLIAEHGAREFMPEAEGSLSVCKQKTYGETLISIYRKS